MAKKTPQEILDMLHVNGVGLDQPTYISPNGGSLEELQQELVEVYQLIATIVESLKDNVWEKQ